jgi:hypothetical protein
MVNIHENKWLVTLLERELETLATVQSAMITRLDEIKADTYADDKMLYPEMQGIHMVSKRIVKRLQEIKEEVDQIIK